MIPGEAGPIVQDINTTLLNAALLAEGQVLRQPVTPPEFTCNANFCMMGARGSEHRYHNSTCDAQCQPFTPRLWVALKSHYLPPHAGESRLTLAVGRLVFLCYHSYAPRRFEGKD
jgi:hypothetical protein